MNAETQSAYISLASNFYATRMQGVELDELNIIGALLRAAPDYRPDYHCVESSAQKKATTSAKAFYR